MITFLGLCLSMGIGTTLIGWEFYANGYPPAGLSLALIGILWLVLQSKWRWISSVGFATLTIAAAIGIILHFSTPLLFTSSVLVLIGWDLSEYHARIRLAAREDQPTRLELAHLTRLGIVIATGVTIAILTQAFTFELTFEWGALLMLASALGISLLIQKLWRTDD